MKKNILLVQSFLILPLLTSSSIFCSEKTYAAAAKGTHLPLRDSGSQGRGKARKKQQAARVVKPLVVEEVVETLTPVVAAQVAENQQAVAQEPAVAAKTPSKYLVTELSAEEAFQAKHDLEKAQSYGKNFAEVLSIIRSINPNHQQLRHVELVTTTQEKSTPVKTVKIELTEDLEKSVMSPSESKGFGFADSILNRIRSYRTTILKLLSNETFEPTDSTHKEYFNLALEECATQKDIQSLTEILKLCKEKEKYNNIQSSLNHVAPAFNFVSDNFSAAVAASNKALMTCNQECAMQINRASAELQEDLTRLLNNHREKISAIAKTYSDRVDNEQNNYNNQKTLLASISALNAKTESYKNELLFEHTLHTPTNAVAAIENDTQAKIRHLLTHKNMPQAKVVQLTDK